MTLNPDDERRLRRNWSLLKQELRVDDFVHKFVENGVFAPTLIGEIANVMPNTPSMKAEKFLNCVITCGNLGYQTLCQLIRNNADNRYSRVMEALQIYPAVHHPGNQVNASTAANNSAVRNVEVAHQDSRPSTAVSSTSSGTVNSETGEKHRRIRNIPTDNNQSNIAAAPVATVAPTVNVFQAGRRTSTGEDSENGGPRLLYAESTLASQSDISLQSFSSTSTDNQTPINKNLLTAQVNKPGTTTPKSIASDGQQQSKNVLNQAVDKSRSDTPLDMQVLEQELVRMAPAIADLFKKIAKQTSSVPTSEEELQKVKDENERLRKTNKSLIEKLNSFQQKIIQLQLDNKKLKENGDTTRAKKEELTVKASELQDMERRLDEHKKALEEKETELNTQLLKLKEIEEENEMQREKIDKLEELQDEGIVERNIQQEQISTLVEEKERQKDQIDSLEEQQKMGEQRLLRLEQRLNQLEQGPRRQGRNRRVMSPPRNNHWMNGYVDRSHHANVKFQSEIKFNLDRDGKRTSSQGKAGWPFI
ncbi:uncharacterized protein LOC132714992 [Ruditapes philippinarum]|uniref:uncharacterized protein LOC132714992 n=1 Tax=Ruditapes philippinarum TaxID=129788 RepID=UPI00295B63F4|nr:uncharacterized protein LOC132714992 [Ruditapes philippinarum]